MKVLLTELKVKEWMDRNRIFVDFNNEVHVCEKCFHALRFQWMSNVYYDDLDINCAGCGVKLTIDNGII